MKRIECIVTHADGEAVVRTMAGAGATGVLMSSLMGVGIERVPYMSCDSWVRVEVVVSDEWAPRLVDLVGAMARKGHLSGGRIMVSGVETLAPLVAGPVGGNGRRR